MKIKFEKTYSDPESRIIISKGTECECEYTFDDMYDIKLHNHHSATFYLYHMTYIYITTMY